MVIVQNSYYCGDDLGRALADEFELVAGAAVRHSVANGCHEPATVLMLRPRHTFASESAGWPTSAAQQLASQITAKFPKLRQFAFSAYASIVKGDLAALSLATIAQITKRNWSSLISVSLNRCGLDSAGMALLAKGNWPMLKIIQLSSNPGIDAAGVADLSAANWPVEELRLCDMPITAATAAELAKLQLPKLEFISLKGAGLTAAAMSELAKADWLRLRELDLCNNALDAAAMQHLSKQQLPALKRLWLRCANITGEGAYWLALGHWPLLTDLDLSMNNLNAKSVEHIASGVWPSLQCLLLDGNPIGGGGAQHLTKGDWPLLQRLVIEHVMLKSPHSAVCLGLNPKWVHSAFPAAVCRGFSVTFPRPTFGMGLWPRLRTVSVHMCPT